jgi:hypothetical protein
MLSFLRYSTTLLAAGLTLAATLGGCSTIAKAIDCDQMCEQLQTCVDGDLDVQRCADRCEDKADNHELRSRLDSCTDCLDQNYACAEVPEECSSCQEVSDALLE